MRWSTVAAWIFAWLAIRATLGAWAGDEGALRGPWADLQWAARVHTGRSALALVLLGWALRPPSPPSAATPRPGSSRHGTGA